METLPVVNHLASVVQTSLAPVFLLAGTAGFVSIYTTRLGRVSDRLNELADTATQNRLFSLQRTYLQRRILALELAVILGVIAGICTCGAILNLLASALAVSLRQENLYWLFGGALLSLVGSLVAFLFEVLIAGRNMLRQIRIDRQSDKLD
ncbi:DUF2721 domain-containing protein [Ochrobactrum quorumnocens]|uniref:DUF2721 domain-containing protein n=1 Tax=Ochrobactrum quorumnocens TaxID=271865 RepID=UPI000AE7FACF|nr:DUF2721 domain-containing protein [[Ochrobactrum] quorumnocens]